MDGRKAALRAGEAGKDAEPQEVERPLILLYDSTESCAQAHDEFINLGFDAVIVENFDYGISLVHDKEGDTPREIAAYVNVNSAKVSGQRAFLTYLDNVAYNRSLTFCISEKVDPVVHAEAVNVGAHWAFEYGDTPEKARQNVAVMALYAMYSPSWGPRREFRKDPLTDLPNAKAFHDAMLRHLNYFQRLDVREGDVISVAYFDGDCFKQVNDTYGHLTGNEVIKTIARAIARSRPYDLHCRFGGDEFILGMPGVTAPEAEGIAERIRVGLLNEAVPTNDPAVFIHPKVSFGTAQVTGREIVGDLEEVYKKLIEEADRRLYKAKENRGRRAVAME
jgi:diguanylate cyclase (GGDEF)-like protein